MSSRVALGTAAVLSVEEAAAWLPMEPEAAEQWLRSSGIVRAVRAGEREIEVVVWDDVVRAVRSESRDEPGPLTTWRAIAAAVGVSEDTLSRRRAAAKDQMAPYFVDVGAARSWYQGLIAPMPKPEAVEKAAPRRRTRHKPAEQQVVDWGAVGRGKWPR